MFCTSSKFWLQIVTIHLLSLKYSPLKKSSNFFFDLKEIVLSFKIKRICDTFFSSLQDSSLPEKICSPPHCSSGGIYWHFYFHSQIPSLYGGHQIVTQTSDVSLHVRNEAWTFLKSWKLTQFGPKLTHSPNRFPISVMVTTKDCEFLKRGKIIASLQIKSWGKTNNFALSTIPYLPGIQTLKKWWMCSWIRKEHNL